MKDHPLTPQDLKGLGPEVPPDAARDLAGLFSLTVRPKGAVIVDQGAPDSSEYALLSGLAVTRIGDVTGRSVCTGLYVGPAVIAPNLARSKDGRSLVRLEMVSDGRIARASAEGLMSLMVADPHVREWGNVLMRAELIRRAERDWALAALPAGDRLEWFRQAYPDLERLFPHGLIASYLGMTPVTLSRLRNA